METENLTISEIKQGIADRKFTAQELIFSYLEKIKKEDGNINSFITVCREKALKQAAAIDKTAKDGGQLPELAGVPIAVKDNILVQGERCTAGSKILDNYIATYDAAVIRKLKACGAIIIGKANLDEFAMGSSGEYSAYGHTKNPLDSRLVPGGSSSGPAAALAAGFCAGALGSDTGGSIRQPASFCGLVGLKPSYGAVSRYGLISLASSLDQIGPLAKNVQDAETIFDAISGKDQQDSTSAASFATAPLETAKLKIGIPREYFADGLDQGVKAALEKAIKKLKEANCEFVEISLPHSRYGIACYQIILPAESSSNLARYDGIRYGVSQRTGNSLEDIYLSSREKGFGVEVKRRIMLGTYALSSGFYEAYYTRAQKVRRLIKDDFTKAFLEVDFIITPTSPTLPFRIGERQENPLAMYLSDLYTVSANLAGVPAISIPCYNVGKLSVGLQIIGRPFREKEIFSLAKLFEKIK